MTSQLSIIINQCIDLPQLSLRILENIDQW